MVTDALIAISEVFAGLRFELCLFASAIVVYLMLFKNVLPKSRGPIQGKGKGCNAGERDGGEARRQQCRLDPNNIMDSEECDELGKAFQIAFDQGDDRAVLQCWSSMKKCEEAPPVPLANVVESMQRLKKDTSAILRELKAYFKRYPSECDAGVVSDVLESLSKRLDSDLMEQIIEMLPSLDMLADPRMYEILLSTYFTMRNFTEVKALVAEMKRKKVPITMRARLVVMKTALKMSNFDEALVCFRELRSMWQDVPPSETTAQRHLV